MRNKLVLPFVLFAMGIGGCAEQSNGVVRPHDTAAPAAKGNLIIATPASSSDVTIYSSSQFAHVQETREVKLPAGPVRIQLNGIAGRYRTDSLRLIKVDGAAGFKYRFATYQPANLTPERLLAESIGKEITAYRHTLGLEPITGTLQSANGNSLVISVGGRTELVTTGDASLIQTPQGLSNTAALVVEADVAVAGTYNIEFQYATDGLTSTAKHSVIYDEEHGQLESWGTYISVVNESGATFPNATVHLLAGRVGDMQESAPGGSFRTMSLAAAAPMSDSAQVESVGDQNVFTIPGTITLTSGQSPLIPLFDLQTFGRSVKVTRTYVVGANYRGRGQQGAQIRLTVDNKVSNHLGQPLPAGSVEVQQRVHGKALQLTGGAWISEKSQDEVFDMNISTSSDVKWELKAISQKEVAGDAGDAADANATAVPAPVGPPHNRLGVSAAPVIGGTNPAATPTFSEREFEIVVYNHKKDRDVEVKVEIAGTLKDLPQGFTASGADRAQKTIKVTKSDKVSVKYTTRTRIR